MNERDREVTGQRIIDLGKEKKMPFQNSILNSSQLN